VTGNQCGDGAITTTGTIHTNGATGTVFYYWVRKDDTGTHVQPKQPLAFTKGGPTTKVVTDTWTPNSAGSEQLVFVSPSYPTQTQSFPCSG
jgi:hypothetical protein